MHPSLSLLIVLSVLAGFFMRPLNMFVFGRVISLLKYTDSKPLVILLFLVSVLSAFSVTMGTIFLSLKLSGFIPLGGATPTFVVSFFIGGALWVIYAKKTNRGCPVDLG